MMKKVCVVLLLLALVTGAVFAETEFCINYSYLYSDKCTMTFDDDDIARYFGTEGLKRTVKSPLGVEGTVSLLFDTPLPNLAAGLGMGAGFDFFSDYEIEDVSLDVNANAFDFSAVLGPALRLTIAGRHSLYLCPGIQFNYRKIDAEPSDNKEDVSYELKEKNWALNFNFGYRAWLLKSSAFKAGLDAGVNMGFPINSFNTFTQTRGGEDDYDMNYKIKSGGFTKFYVGCCVNFGKKK